MTVTFGLGIDMFVARLHGAGEVPQQAEIEKAAEAASAHDFILKLEEKYNSMIGHSSFFLPNLSKKNH